MSAPPTSRLISLTTAIPSDISLPVATMRITPRPAAAPAPFPPISSGGPIRERPALTRYGAER